MKKFLTFLCTLFVLTLLTTSCSNESEEENTPKESEIILGDGVADPIIKSTSTLASSDCTPNEFLPYHTISFTTEHGKLFYITVKNGSADRLPSGNYNHSTEIAEKMFRGNFTIFKDGTYNEFEYTSDITKGQMQISINKEGVYTIRVEARDESNQKISIYYKGIPEFDTFIPG